MIPKFVIIKDESHVIFTADQNGISDIPPPNINPDSGLVGNFQSVGRQWASIHVGFGIIAFSEPIFRQLKSAKWPCERIRPLTRINSSRKSVQGEPPCHWVLARVESRVTTVRSKVPSKWGAEEAVSFIFSTQGLSSLEFIRSIDTYVTLCPLMFLVLARRYKWSGLRFYPADLPQTTLDNFSIDYLGEQWPPQWWPDDYEPHSSNVVEGKVPDVKIGEGLVGEFAPAQTRPAKVRPVKTEGPLISASATRSLTLEESDGGYELEGEITLARPLYGAETLSVLVSMEGDADEKDGPRLSKSQIKQKVQETLARLETLLPTIHVKLMEEGAPHAATPEEFVSSLRSPGLIFDSAQLLSDHWSFVVESEIVGFHFEFDGEELTEIWAGD